MKPPGDPEPSHCFWGFSFLIYQMGITFTQSRSTSQSREGCASILLTAWLMSHSDFILASLASVCLFVKREPELC